MLFIKQDKLKDAVNDFGLAAVQAARVSTRVNLCVDVLQAKVWQVYPVRTTENGKGDVFSSLHGDRWTKIGESQLIERLNG